MADKIFDNYQGPTIRIGGICYTFLQETTSAVNAIPSEIEETFASCLECENASSSSSSSFGFSSSSSSIDSSSSSLGNSSSSSTANVHHRYRFCDFVDLSSSSSSSEGLTSESSSSSLEFLSQSSESSSTSSEGYSSSSSIDSDSSSSSINSSSSSDFEYFTDLIFEDYQGDTVQVGGFCYTWIEETTDPVNTTPGQIEQTYNNCGECGSNFCTGGCSLVVQFQSYHLADRMQVTDGTGVILDTGYIATGGDYAAFELTGVQCPVTVCVFAPTVNTLWALKINGCGFNVNTQGTQVDEICFTSEEDGPSIPQLDISVSWSDGDASKILFGQVWTNGQTKTVTPSYNCSLVGNGNENFNYVPTNSPPSPFSTFTEKLNASASGVSPSSVGSQQNIIQIKGIAIGTVGGTDIFQLSYTYGTQSGGAFNNYFYKYNVASMGFAKSNFTPTPPGRPLQNFQFSSITTTNGLTVSWSKTVPSAWNTCGL